MERTAAMEKDMELKLTEFEVKFEEKMKDLDDTFHSLLKRQNNTEKLVSLQHEQSVKVIEEKSREVHNNIIKIAQNTIKKYEDKLGERNIGVEKVLKDIKRY